MNIEKIDNEILNEYNLIMSEQERSNKKYLLFGWIISLATLFLYFSYNQFFIYIFIIVVLSIITMIYKTNGFKDGFKYGYLRGKNINLIEYNTEKLKK